MTSIKKLFNKLFGKEPEPEYESLHTDGTSQGYVLVARMKEAGIKHGQYAHVDIDRVRITNDFPRNINGVKEGDETVPVARFCATEKIKVHNTANEGDNEPLPQELNMEVKIPKDLTLGEYRMKNVILYGNGKLNILPTPESKLVKI